MSKAKKPSKRSRKNKAGKTANSKAASSLASIQILNDIRRTLGGQPFQSLDQANEFLKTLIGPDLKRALTKVPVFSPREQAQELAYEAMEEVNKKQSITLAKQALAKDPDCVDALVIVAKATSGSLEKLIDRMEKAVVAGERSLGTEYFEANKGHFWGLIETRPYMRARADLASFLLENDQIERATSHLEALLILNPSDNQGLRDTLLGCYLAKDNLIGAKRLFHEYSENKSTFFLWGQTLERILSGAFEDAEKVLREARLANTFVEIYITGQKKLPVVMPDAYSLGGEDEAIICVDILGRAWAAHPEALLWLKRQIKGEALIEN